MDRRTFVVGLSALFFAFSLMAAPAMADEKTLEGKVSVVKEGDAVKSVELAVGDKKYTVKQDDNGKKVAALDGKNVVVKGEVSDKNEVTVKTVEEKKEEAKK